jgi:hypothetical protein
MLSGDHWNRFVFGILNNQPTQPTNFLSIQPKYGVQPANQPTSQPIQPTNHPTMATMATNQQRRAGSWHA